MAEMSHVGMLTLQQVGAERLQSYGTISNVEFMRVLEKMNVNIIPSHVRTVALSQYSRYAGSTAALCSHFTVVALLSQLASMFITSY